MAEINVPAEEIEVGDIVVMDDSIHEVLEVFEHSDGYYVTLSDLSRLDDLDPDYLFRVQTR